MKYAIAEVQGREAFEDFITQLMARGWRPQGGVWCEPNMPADRRVYYQAMVMEDWDEN